MRWLDWLRDDLQTRDRQIERCEFPFLLGGVVLIVIAASWQDPGTAMEVLLISAAGAVIVGWPFMPAVPPELVAVVVTALVLAAIAGDGALELAFFLVVLVNLYVSWHVGSTVRPAALAVLCSAAIIGITVWTPAREIASTPWVAAQVFTLVAGRTLFRQRALIEELEIARQALADQAVLQERQRIAREFHDLSGHTLAAMLLHLTGARHVLRRDPAEAERALRDAEAVGRSAMDRIRVTVAALRSDERGTDPALPETGDLRQVIDEYRRAGLAIDAPDDALPVAVAGPTAIAVHRIVRESLTNVARHAPDHEVTITAEVDEPAGRLRLEVRDKGRRSAPPATIATAARFGLIGMEERARALGGTLDAGPTDDGWSVVAEFPVRADLPSATPR